MDLEIIPSGQTIVKPTALGPVANTDTKLLIYGLFQKGRVLAQDGVPVVDEVSLAKEETIPHVSEVSCHLLHPLPVLGPRLSHRWCFRNQVLVAAA